MFSQGPPTPCTPLRQAAGTGVPSVGGDGAAAAESEDVRARFPEWSAASQPQRHETCKRARYPSECADGGFVRSLDAAADSDSSGVYVVRGLQDIPEDEHERMHDIVLCAMADMRALNQQFERDAANVLDLVRPEAGHGYGVGGGSGGVPR